MIRLQEYCLENLVSIFEASFKPDDYNKHDYVYVLNVLNDIKEKHVIKLGDKNGGPFKYLKLDITDNLIENINKFIENIKSSTPDSFNELFKNINYIVYNDVNCKEETSIKNIDNLWSLIFKGDYSGKNSAGASYGNIFESLVCYLYNYGTQNNYDEKLINNWVKRFNVNMDDPSYLSWIESSKISADLLKKHFKSNYIAYHIDANDLFNNQKDNKYLNICKIFSGKNGINDVLGNNDIWDSIYDGNKKDKWNAADIVLVSKELDLNKTIKDLGSSVDGKALNTKLVEYTINKKILPISLKKIDKNGKIYAHNINTNEEFINDEHEISDIKIVFGKTYPNDGLTGNFIIDGKDARIQVRKQSSGENLSIEAKLSDNKNARGGKGISVIKNKFNLKDNSYYVLFNTNDELWNFFKLNNFDIDLTKSEFDALANKFLDLKDRICFRGFAGLYNTWNEYNKNNNVKVTNPVIEFIKFLWESCTECPGAYYIIK